MYDKLCPYYYSYESKKLLLTWILHPSSYRRLIGRLIYLTNTHSYITHDVHHLNQFQHHLNQFMYAPTDIHQYDVMRILCYLKGT